MRTLRRAFILALAASLLFGVTACGQMGPLTLPDDAPSGADDEDNEDDDER